MDNIMVAKILFTVSFLFFVGDILWLVTNPKKNKRVKSKKEWLTHSEEWSNGIGQISEASDSSYDEEALNLFSKDSEENEEKK